MNKTVLKFVGLGVLVAITIALISEYTIKQRIDTYAAAVTVLQSNQRTLLESIAGITARSGLDNLSEGVLQDCTPEERVQFDFLLSRLDAGLTQSQLVELNNLFSGCGPYFSERKSLMVTRLQREFEVYREYTELLETVTEESESAEAALDEWEQLVALETAQAEQFRTLVLLQSQIIESLLDGNSVESPALSEILAEVREVRENQALANTQARELRTALTSD